MQVEWLGTDQDPGGDFGQITFPTFSSLTCSLCFPQTVRMHTRKVRVATITCDTASTFGHWIIPTSQGWVAQNSPWLRNTFLNISFNACIWKYHFIPNF